MPAQLSYPEHRKKMHKLGPLHTLKEFLLRLTVSAPQDVLVVEKDGNEKINYTARQLSDDVKALATALLHRGFAGKNIAVLAENSYRWIVCFLAIVSSGGVAVPLDKEVLDEDILILLRQSDAKAVFCSQTFSALARRAFGEPCSSLLLYDDRQENDCSWSRLLQTGRELLARGDTAFDDAPVCAQDLAAIVYTSGTTGFNKGVMLTHGNFASNINTIVESVAFEDSTISVLPMNHVYELNCNILPMLYMHTRVCINDRMRNLMHNLRFFRPHMAVVVPLFLESFYENIYQKIRKGGLDQKIRRLVAVSNRLLDNGIDMRRVLFSRVHSYFGGELRLLVCGGAPVNQKYIDGLTELGFDIYVGYGLTEAAPIAALNTKPCARPDSVGRAFPNTGIHIYAPDNEGEGEIWLRGENITPGYYGDEAATHESFEGGWFKTGDYGKLSEDGFLYLTGRKKNLIIMDNGKNVHPEEIEQHIRSQLSYVSEVVVMETEKEIFGKKQKIIAAVLYIDADAFPTQTAEEIEQTAKTDMMSVNSRLPGYKTVNHVIISSDSFQKNSTNKIIRQKVIDQYAGNAQQQVFAEGGKADV